MGDEHHLPAAGVGETSRELGFAQAAELLAGPAAGTETPVILACDCNSDPLDASVKPGESHAHRDPYLRLTGTGGLADEWPRFALAQQGGTSGVSELVNDTPSRPRPASITASTSSSPAAPTA